MMLKKQNVLSTATIAKVRTYAEAQTHVRTNHRNWRPEVVSISGPIYLVDLVGELSEIVASDVRAAFPEFDVSGLEISATYTCGGRLSFIPWHDDHNHVFSVTVYVNEVWDRDWGGHFLYEHDNALHAVLPAFNTAVGFACPLQHCTMMPNLNAPLRESIQIFFGEVL